jgi:glycosyltransferase involved in cell wall biosynthesis
MKVLHVIPDVSLRSGGPVSAIRGLTHAQRRSGHNVRIVTTDYDLPDDYAASDNEIHCKCILAAWRYASGLGKELNKNMQWSDVVHIHTVWEYPTLIATRVAKKMNKPFLLRPCGMLDAWSMTQSAFKKKIYLALHSKDIFSDGCTMHFTTEAEKNKSVYPQSLDSVVIENGIAENAFSEGNCAEAFLECYPELKGKDIVLFLGRVHPKKQPDIAVKAFSRIAAEFPDARLVIGGPCETAYKAELSRMAGNLRHERVLFTGMLQGKTLYGAFRAATVFLLPSMQENFGIAVAEAMANYCPVIISEHVDIKDYIRRGNAGIVCEANVKSFASAISGVLSMPQNSAIMGNNGRMVAEKYFRWDIASECLDDIYKKVISNSK